MDIDLMRTPEEFADEIKRLRSDIEIYKKRDSYSEIIIWNLRARLETFGHSLGYVPIKCRECESLRSELARYQTPNVDNIEVINDQP